MPSSNEIWKAARSKESSRARKTREPSSPTLLNWRKRFSARLRAVGVPVCAWTGLAALRPKAGMTAVISATRHSCRRIRATTLVTCGGTPCVLECASMRAPVTLFVSACVCALLPAYAPAEVIHLKNGRIIWADHVRESGSRIEYDVGDDSYGIPKSLVERIDTGGVPPPSNSPATGDQHDLPGFVPADNLKNDA